MFIYNFKEWKMPDITIFKSNLNVELCMLENQISHQLNNKEVIYKDFINMPILTYLDLTNTSILIDFNISFNLVNNILDSLNPLRDSLINIKEFINNTNFENNFDRDKFLITIQEKLEIYYNLKSKIQPQVIEKTKELDDKIAKLNLISLNSNINTISNEKPTIPLPEKIEETLPKIAGNNIIQNTQIIENTQIFENIENNKENEIDKLNTFNNNLKSTAKSDKVDNKLLLISEKEDKVYLPYLISDLEEIFKTNSNYTSIDDIIEKQYILPLSRFKNNMFSRFKESYNLIKNKEKGTFKEAFFLGMEQMNNYKLHPAVIAACRNEDELDIYLDCLDGNELDNFEFFDIQFEISPTVRIK